MTHQTATHPTATARRRRRVLLPTVTLLAFVAFVGGVLALSFMLEDRAVRWRRLRELALDEDVLALSIEERRALRDRVAALWPAALSEEDPRVKFDPSPESKLCGIFPRSRQEDDRFVILLNARARFGGMVKVILVGREGNLLAATGFDGDLRGVEGVEVVACGVRRGQDGVPEAYFDLEPTGGLAPSGGAAPEPRRAAFALTEDDRIVPLTGRD